MKKIFYVLSICILGFVFFACGDKNNSAKKVSLESLKDSKSIETKDSKGIETKDSKGIETKDSKSIETKDSKSAETKAQTINMAFDQVVKVLHAPYESGSLFFRIFTSNTPTYEVNDATMTQIGEGKNNGSGTWVLKAGKDDAKGEGKNNTIVYHYLAYQPKGSDIIINGKMKSMYRSQTKSEIDSIGFNQNSIGHIKNVDLTMVDTLKIDGAYTAMLKFIYPFGATHKTITKANYENYLFGDDMGLFTALGSRVEFTYKDKTIELNNHQLKKLLIVA